VSKDYPEHVRRIRFKDPESGKSLIFLTNNTALPPLTIAPSRPSFRWRFLASIPFINSRAGHVAGRLVFEQIDRESKNTSAANFSARSGISSLRPDHSGIRMMPWPAAWRASREATTRRP
jgi:hypothetical protein